MPPNLPYTKEAENVFRKALLHESAILYGHTEGVMSAAFSPDGKRIVSASSDHTIRIWDAWTGKQIGAPFEGCASSVHSVAFSPDGKLIVSALDNGSIRMWDAQTEEQSEPRFKGMQAQVTLPLSVLTASESILHQVARLSVSGTILHFKTL